MKYKNYILGISTTLIAVTAAVASSYHTPQVSAWVRVKYQGQSTFTCVNTGLTCSVTGPVFCKVSVKIDVPASTKIVRAHHDQTCDVYVLHNMTSAGTYDPAAVIIDASD